MRRNEERERVKEGKGSKKGRSRRSDLDQVEQEGVQEGKK